ncbi:hypothetical protein JVT61DRAFT_13698 [Boletus reticuloceps]|uniref:Uncharacterized protein n=1 Tax=Boletus reticuloceps TaxID=495285 RepID=A0A8I2YRW7_9AGAM|nr:hypothetical protein JVT61DRAFT_13698 [Boletus reticuloceps]
MAASNLSPPPVSTHNKRFKNTRQDSCIIHLTYPHYPQSFDPLFSSLYFIFSSSFIFMDVRVATYTLAQ